MNRSIVYQFKKKYEALNLTAKNKLKDDVTSIKSDNLKNLDQLIPECIENLKNNGIKVHLVKNAKDAGKKLAELVNDEPVIVKSKSNAINQIDLNKAIPKTKVVETDLGDFISQVVKKHDKHPVLPALSLTPKEIADKLNSEFKANISDSPKEIANWVRNYLRETIKKANIGLTGANVITKEGEIFLLENEGNISLISRMPVKHVVISGVEKIVSESTDALKITQALANWGTGQKRATYVSIITGPSKTADIQNELIIGAQGTKEVDLILIDDRETYKKAGLEEVLKCINCGACLSLCPAYHMSEQMDQYEGIKAMADRYIKNFCNNSETKKDTEPKCMLKNNEDFYEMPFLCTTCGMCSNICPVGIKLREILLLIRKNSEQPVNNLRMFKYIEKYGNPFGDKGKEVEELYCC